MRVLIVALLCLQASAVSAQLYRWTDAQGRIHYTDTPPPVNARNVEEKKVSTSYSPPVEPYSLQQARKSSPVKLYSSPGCQPCESARTLLNSRGIPFTEVSVTGEPQQLEELKNVVGTSAVPALVVGSASQAGFEESMYHRMLDAAGYPGAGVLPPRNQEPPRDDATEDSGSPLPNDAQQGAEEPRGPYAPRFR